GLTAGLFAAALLGKDGGAAFGFTAAGLGVGRAAVGTRSWVLFIPGIREPVFFLLFAFFPCGQFFVTFAVFRGGRFAAAAIFFCIFYQRLRLLSISFLGGCGLFVGLGAYIAGRERA